MIEKIALVIALCVASVALVPATTEGASVLPTEYYLRDEMYNVTTTGTTQLVLGDEPGCNLNLTTTIGTGLASEYDFTARVSTDANCVPSLEIVDIIGHVLTHGQTGS